MPYSIKISVFSTGERFAHLIDSETQLPHFDSTIFNMVMLRGRGLATSTIEQVLRAIKILILFCEVREISLSTRMQSGTLFQCGELDELLRLCRKPMADIGPALLSSKSHSAKGVTNRIRLFPSSRSGSEVCSKWVADRITYIREFVNWLADRQLSRLTENCEKYRMLREQKDAFYKKLKATVPMKKGRNNANSRMGLSEEQQESLWRVVASDSTENVWVGRHCRVRNELMVRMFHTLGLRRGELAGVSVRDINFRMKTILIRRRADDRQDPRVIQPNAKTRDRILPLSDSLLRRIQDYVIGERKLQSRAKTHQFLFVANGGNPLGLRAINKIFETLVKRCGAFIELFPHLLRHTFNDNLSAHMDANKTSEAEEERIRSALNGWKPSSGTAATYTKRTIERKANEASLLIQEKRVVKPIND